MKNTILIFILCVAILATALEMFFMRKSIESDLDELNTEVELISEQVRELDERVSALEAKAGITDVR